MNLDKFQWYGASDFLYQFTYVPHQFKSASISLHLCVNPDSFGGCSYFTAHRYERCPSWQRGCLWYPLYDPLELKNPKQTNAVICHCGSSCGDMYLVTVCLKVFGFWKGIEKKTSLDKISIPSKIRFQSLPQPSYQSNLKENKSENISSWEEKGKCLAVKCTSHMLMQRVLLAFSLRSENM